MGAPVSAHLLRQVAGQHVFPSPPISDQLTTTVWSLLPWSLVTGRHLQSKVMGKSAGLWAYGSIWRKFGRKVVLAGSVFFKQSRIGSGHQH